MHNRKVIIRKRESEKEREQLRKIKVLRRI